MLDVTHAHLREIADPKMLARALASEEERAAMDAQENAGSFGRLFELQTRSSG